MLFDGLKNFVASLGTPRDKAAGAVYAGCAPDPEQLANAYQYSWLPRKIVDIPALDATRKWRNWQADKDQITAIESEEKRLGLQNKVRECMTKARLYGGAGIYIGVDGSTRPDQPLSPATVRQGGLRYLTVLPMRILQVAEMEDDPISPNYGRPRMYQLNSTTQGAVFVHPSRVAAFIGAPLPDDTLGNINRGWGDSILAATMEACKQADATLANIVSLIYEAKVDVLGIPNLTALMADPKTRDSLVNRAQLAAMLKGNNGMFLRDAEETYDSKSFAFANLDNIGNLFLQVASGAADIPTTRLLGMSPGGLNSSGESDLRNYYDRIQSIQSLDMAPALATLDECLIRSALGGRPPETYYEWAPLWQVTEKERADIGKTVADTLKTIAETGLFPDDALSAAAENTLTEWGILPGLEAAMDEFGAEPLPEPEPIQVGDAAPRTLYVHRKVLNATDIIAWAKAQGFETTIPADDLHVTIAYSRAPVDWMKVGEPWSGDKDGTLTVKPGGARMMDVLGGGAVVLLFNSSELSWRHRDILESGASWDWPDYQPHITITYEQGGVDLAKVEPYRGAIELGPEVFEELDENWKNNVSEE